MSSESMDGKKLPGNSESFVILPVWLLVAQGFIKMLNIQDWMVLKSLSVLCVITYLQNYALSKHRIKEHGIFYSSSAKTLS